MKRSDWPLTPALCPLKTTRYANRQSGHVEGVAILWVRLPLWSLTTIPWSNGDDTCVTCRRRWFNSIRDHSRRQESGVRLGSERIFLTTDP
jgi:hypothetical protein